MQYTGHPSSIPGWRRTPGGGNGNPLQYSGLQKAMERGDSQATVHWAIKSQKWQWLSTCIHIQLNHVAVHLELTQEFKSAFSSVTQSCLTLCDPMDCSTSGSSVHHQPLELAQTHVHWVSEPSIYLILCCSLLLLPSIFPSIRVFSNELALPIRWPKFWSFSFSFSISPSSEYSGLISFRIDWFDLLALQGTLKSLLQHHSLKVSILQCSAFFMVQLSYPYMTTGITIALTIWTFFSKVMSLLFNMLPMLIAL